MSLEHLVLRQWETAILWPPKGVIGDLYLVTKLHPNHAALPLTIPVPEAEVAMSLEHLVLRQWETAISWPPKGVIGDPLPGGVFAAGPRRYTPRPVSVLKQKSPFLYAG